MFDVLKITYGLFLIVIGLDKFFDLIVNWSQYVHPSIYAFVSHNVLISSVGILEIILGLLILSPWLRTGCYATILWMVVVIVDLLALGYFDIAARDVLIAMGIFTLVILSEVKDDLT